MGGGCPQSWQKGANVTQKVIPSPDSDTRYEGVIKSFFPEKKYGFISCEVLSASHGGDVFLSDQEIGSHAAGEYVSFQVAFNSSNRPQARNLQAAVGAGTAWNAE